MKCDDFLNKIEDFFLKELSGSEEDCMAEHIATCSHCEDAWLDYKQIEKTLGKLSETEIANHTSKQIVFEAAANYLENNRKNIMTRFLSWFKLHPLFATSVAITAVLLVTVFNSYKPEITAPTPFAVPQKSAELLATDNYEEASLTKTNIDLPLNQISELVSANKCNEAKNLADQLKLADNQAIILLLKNCKPPSTTRHLTHPAP